MKTPIRFSLELLISTYSYKNNITPHLPNSVLVFFLEIIGEYDEIEKSVVNEFSMISREEFTEQYSIEKLKESIEAKKQAIMKQCKKIPRQDSYFVYFNELMFGKYNRLYENYVSETYHKRGKEITVFKYGLKYVENIYNKVRKVASDIVRLNIIEEVSEELEFYEVYNPNELKIVDKPADACWEEMSINSDLTVEELIDLVLKRYWIELYKDENEKQRVSKTKKAVRSRYKYITNKWNE